MNITITSKESRDKKKKWYYLEWGKSAGQRKATGIFTYVKPKDHLQRNHNKEALKILETKKSQMIIERHATGSGYIPAHKIKNNFLDYYREYIKAHPQKGNRHLTNSLAAFTGFIGKEYVSSVEITENLCEQFRSYLLEKYNGETPSGYFMRFKRVLKAAAKDGYFRNSPAEDLVAKTGGNKRIKEILTAEEYTQLLNTPCLNHEVKKAFIFSLYTGLRWVDVKSLTWDNIKSDVFFITQKKTGNPLELPLHQTAKKILGERKKGLVFQLPTHDGANKVLAKWCDDAKLNKHITWHCARHSFSVLLQDKGVDSATVSGMLGHSSTKYVQTTYTRYRQKNAVEAINKLPS